MATATNARTARSSDPRSGTTAPTHSANSASAEAKSSANTVTPSTDQSAVRASAAPLPRPVMMRTVRPSQGRPRRPASGQATAARTKPGRVRPRTSATAPRPAPVSRQRTTIHSASLTTTVADSARHRAAQVRVNGSRRLRLAASRTTEAATRTRNIASPKSRNGSTIPANSPTPTAPSRTGTLPGTERSGQKSSKAVSIRDGTAARLGGGGGGGGGGAVAAWPIGAAGDSVMGISSGRVRVGASGRSARARAPCAPGSGSAKPIVPSCRSVTQRAIARPSPVPPPPSVSLRVPKRSKARSRFSGSTPGPWSATSSCQRSPMTRARMVTVPPGGLCRDALSSRLATSWRRRAGSPWTARSGGLTSTSYPTSRPPTWDSATAESSSGRTSTVSRTSGALPASTRARSSRSVTRAVIRSPWSRAARRVAGSGSATPSARFSSSAQSAVKGVRSSWLTLATSSRRCRSTPASSSAIWLNARASSPTSSREVAVTRTEWSPSAIRLAATVISRSGEVMPTARSWVTASARAMVSGMLSQIGTPPAEPIVARIEATVTLAATSSPSFTFTERTGSRARTLISRLRSRARSRPRAPCGPDRPRSWRAGPSRGCRPCGSPRHPASPTPRPAAAPG